MSVNEWIFVGLFMAIAWTIPAIAIVLGKILGPKRPNPVKSEIYECGIETHGESWIQLQAQYYVFALVFLIFDVEVVFLFPWALAYNRLGLFALVEMFIFIFLLVVALVYTWRKGVLEWS